MVSKQYTRTGKICRVTFSIQPESNVHSVSLCGDFNNWDHAAHPMKQRKNGSFSTTVSLPTGFSYEFRYLIDRKCWKNDECPDAFVTNEFGSDNCLIQV